MIPWQHSERFTKQEWKEAHLLLPKLAEFEAIKTKLSFKKKPKTQPLQTSSSLLKTLKLASYRLNNHTNINYHAIVEISLACKTFLGLAKFLTGLKHGLTRLKG